MVHVKARNSITIEHTWDNIFEKHKVMGLSIYTDKIYNLNKDAFDTSISQM